MFGRHHRHRQCPLGGGAVTIGGSGAGEANNVSDNGDPQEDTGFDVGIYLSAVEQATIEGNTVTGHIDPAGVYELGGICLEGSSYNFIIGNTVTDNGGGIFLEGSSLNEIGDNTVTGNDGGIFLDDDSDENSVADNVIQDNDWDGIYIGGDDNEILRNDISGNLGEECAGIYLWGEGNVIHFNNITGNTDIDSCGVYNDNDETDVDATLNWWGDASGPYQKTTNPEGLGDEVSDDVIYSPWLGYEAGTSPMTFIADDVGPALETGYIQPAVESADPGDTINVLAGEYEEDLLINKSLTLQGAGADVTSITGTLPGVVNIVLDGETVLFDGFTVLEEEYLIYLDVVNGSSLTISNNILASCGGAIYCPADTLDNDSTVIIEDNEIYNAEYFGIGFEVIAGGSELTVRDNDIYNAQFGVLLGEVKEDSEVTIQDNTIYECGGAIYCSEETVDGGSTVTIEDNEIYYAEIGIGFDAVAGGSEVNIGNNDIHDTGGAIGFGAVVGGSKVNIGNNTINENGDGIYLEEVSNDSTVAIFGNNITNNIETDDSGIHIEATDTTNVRVNFNNIVGNGPLGAYYGGFGSLELDAENNWWGSANGPGEDGANGTDGPVDYEPWLSAPVTGCVSRTGTGGDIDATNEADTVVYIWGGTADVTIANYGSNPGSGFSGDTGKYVDVHD